MTRLHIAVDHGGYDLGRELQKRAEDAGYEVVWHGADSLDPGDDYPLFTIAAAKATVVDQDAAIDAFGVVVVDDAAAGVIAANTVNGARAVLATSPRGAATAREVVDANVLVFEGVAFEENAWHAIAAFVTTGLPHDVRRGRQILQIEEYENAGTIEGWAVQLEPDQVVVTHDS